MIEDLIKRGDAAEVVYKALKTPPPKGVLTDTMSLAIALVRGIPSTDRPQGEWIPCSERLPKEEKGVYLICTDYGYMCSCRWTNDVYGLGANEWSAWGWCRLDVPQYSRVVAWMDLKPWRGKNDEQTN